VLSNAYFKQLLDTKWEADTSPSGRAEFRAPAAPGVSQERGALVYMMPEDLVIKQDPALAALAREYAQDNAKFVKDFAAAWKRMMNADRFDGPVGSVC
jgi:catalase-peroxidase